MPDGQLGQQEVAEVQVERVCSGFDTWVLASDQGLYRLFLWLSHQGTQGVLALQVDVLHQSLAVQVLEQLVVLA